MKTKQCPFCTKNQGHKIYENELIYVIYNIRPGKNKGRCFVIPKRHVESIRELTEKELIVLFKTVKFISSRLAKYLKPEGFNYGWNEGKIAGQTIKHFHFHIMPRYKNDGMFKFHLFHRNPKDKKDLSEEELKPLIEEFKKIFKD